ncbi:uncharacterized protein LOC143236617 [Tachypleus tridentatus]|uniref:uncharacterized protein LOC143236617 n=1 Tax=Tachypleus tridentatus TaxID=6853 RepID=UPI003FD3FB2D
MSSNVDTATLISLTRNRNRLMRLAQGIKTKKKPGSKKSINLKLDPAYTNIEHLVFGTYRSRSTTPVVEDKSKGDNKVESCEQSVTVVQNYGCSKDDDPNTSYKNIVCSLEVKSRDGATGQSTVKDSEHSEFEINGSVLQAATRQISPEIPEGWNGRNDNTTVSTSFSEGCKRDNEHLSVLNLERNVCSADEQNWLAKTVSRVNGKLTDHGFPCEGGNMENISLHIGDSEAMDNVHSTLNHSSEKVGADVFTANQCGIFKTSESSFYNENVGNSSCDNFANAVNYTDDSQIFATPDSTYLSLNRECHEKTDCSDAFCTPCGNFNEENLGEPENVILINQNNESDNKTSVTPTSSGDYMCVTAAKSFMSSLRDEDSISMSKHRTATRFSKQSFQSTGTVKKQTKRIPIMEREVGSCSLDHINDSHCINKSESYITPTIKKKLSNESAEHFRTDSNRYNIKGDVPRDIGELLNMQKEGITCVRSSSKICSRPSSVPTGVVCNSASNSLLHSQSFPCKSSLNKCQKFRSVSISDNSKISLEGKKSSDKTGCPVLLTYRPLSSTANLEETHQNKCDNVQITDSTSLKVLRIPTEKSYDNQSKYSSGIPKPKIHVKRTLTPFNSPQMFLASDFVTKEKTANEDLCDLSDGVNTSPDHSQFFRTKSISFVSRKKSDPTPSFRKAASVCEKSKVKPPNIPTIRHLKIPKHGEYISDSRRSISLSTGEFKNEISSECQKQEKSVQINSKARGEAITCKITVTPPSHIENDAMGVNHTVGGRKSAHGISSSFGTCNKSPSRSSLNECESNLTFKPVSKSLLSSSNSSLTGSKTHLLSKHDVLNSTKNVRKINSNDQTVHQSSTESLKYLKYGVMVQKSNQPDKIQLTSYLGSYTNHDMLHNSSKNEQDLTKFSVKTNTELEYGEKENRLIQDSYHHSGIPVPSCSQVNNSKKETLRRTNFASKNSSNIKPPVPIKPTKIHIPPIVNNKCILTNFTVSNQTLSTNQTVQKSYTKSDTNVSFMKNFIDKNHCSTYDNYKFQHVPETPKISKNGTVLSSNSIGPISQASNVDEIDGYKIKDDEFSDTYLSPSDIWPLETHPSTSNFSLRSSTQLCNSDNIYPCCYTDCHQDTSMINHKTSKFLSVDGDYRDVINTQEKTSRKDNLAQTCDHLQDTCRRIHGEKSHGTKEATPSCVIKRSESFEEWAVEHLKALISPQGHEFNQVTPQVFPKSNSGNEAPNDFDNKTQEKTMRKLNKKSYSVPNRMLHNATGVRKNPSSGLPVRSLSLSSSPLPYKMASGSMRGFDAAKTLLPESAWDHSEMGMSDIEEKDENSSSGASRAGSEGPTEHCRQHTLSSKRYCSIKLDATKNKSRIASKFKSESLGLERLLPVGFPLTSMTSGESLKLFNKEDGIITSTSFDVNDGNTKSSNWSSSKKKTMDDCSDGSVAKDVEDHSSFQHLNFVSSSSESPKLDHKAMGVNSGDMEAVSVSDTKPNMGDHVTGLDSTSKTTSGLLGNFLLPSRLLRNRQISKSERHLKASSTPEFVTSSSEDVRQKQEVRRPWSYVYSEKEAQRLLDNNTSTLSSISTVQKFMHYSGETVLSKLGEQSSESGLPFFTRYSSVRSTSTRLSGNDGVLQKFRKSFSLRFQKGRKSSSSPQSTIGQEGTGSSNEPVIPQVVLPDTSDHVCTSSSEVLESSASSADQDQTNQKNRTEDSDVGFKIGPLILRTSRERRKAKRLKKDARESKCNSADSGIQLESLFPSSEGPTESSSAADSPAVIRRRAASTSESSPKVKPPLRPHSDTGGSLAEALSIQLGERSRSSKERRPSLDLCNTGLLQSLQKVPSVERQMSTPPPIKVRTERSRPLLRRHKAQSKLRRSISQPLDLEKLGVGLKIEDNLHGISDHSASAASSDDEFSSDGEGHHAFSNKDIPFREVYGDSVTFAEALWDHVTIDTEELAFKAGEVIEVTDLMDKDWWWGSVADRSGWFPAAFVRLRVNQEDTVEDCISKMADGTLTRQPPRKMSVSLLSNEQVRANVIQEIISTEKDFVQHLKDVVEGYLKQVRRRPDMFSADRIATVFGNIQEIYRFQSSFLQQLEACMDWDAPYNSLIGDCFSQHKEEFRIYSDYCNNHPLAVSELQELYSYPKYCHFFEACRLLQDMIDISLDGFLLTPVQKICKYPLQLAELLKYTHVDHPDYQPVKNALEAMREVAQLVNERKRRMECLERIAEWQQSVDGWEGPDLLTTSSVLIHNGDVTRVSPAWSREHSLFLFDHLLVYCKKDILKRNNFVYKGRIPLDFSRVLDVEDGKDSQFGVTVKHAWKIYCGSREKWFMFYTKTAAEKDCWMQAFREERKLVEEDKEQGFIITEQAKKAAKLALLNKQKPKRPRAKIPKSCRPHPDTAVVELLLDHPGSPKTRSGSLPSNLHPSLLVNLGNRHSPPKKKGSGWFNFGSGKKPRK